MGLNNKYNLETDSVSATRVSKGSVTIGCKSKQRHQQTATRVQSNTDKKKESVSIQIPNNFSTS